MATHSSVLAWRIPGTEEPGIYGVAQSQTGLKQISSSSINIQICCAPFMCKNDKPCSDASFPVLFVTLF